MNLKKYIEMGEKAAGSQQKLAKHLTINDGNLRKAKRGGTTLPDATCIKLAHLIHEEPIHVIAASNLVTEKNEERRKLFESCMASIAIAAFAVVLLFNTTTSEAKSMLHNNNTLQNIVTFYTL